MQAWAAQRLLASDRVLVVEGTGRREAQHGLQRLHVRVGQAEQQQSAATQLQHSHSGSSSSSSSNGVSRRQQRQRRCLALRSLLAAGRSGRCPLPGLTQSSSPSSSGRSLSRRCSRRPSPPRTASHHCCSFESSPAASLRTAAARHSSSCSSLAPSSSLSLPVRVMTTALRRCGQRRHARRAECRVRGASSADGREKMEKRAVSNS